MPRHLPAVLAMGLVIACASPTLPLPPPSIPDQAMVDSTHVTLSSGCGGVEGGATVDVKNQDETPPGTTLTTTGWRASACGSWSATVFGRAGDHLVVWQEVYPDVGLPLQVIVGKLQ